MGALSVRQHRLGLQYAGHKTTSLWAQMQDRKGKIPSGFLLFDQGWWLLNVWGWQYWIKLTILIWKYLSSLHYLFSLWSPGTRMESVKKINTSPEPSGGLTSTSCQMPTQPPCHSPFTTGLGEKMRSKSLWVEINTIIKKSKSCTQKQTKKRNLFTMSHWQADVQPHPGKQGLRTHSSCSGRQTT